jgi:hypothetical protein
MSQFWPICGELEGNSVIRTIMGREAVGDADWNRGIHSNEIRTPVAAGTGALDRSCDPTVLLHFTGLHVELALLQ